MNTAETCLFRVLDVMSRRFLVNLVNFLSTATDQSLWRLLHVYWTLLELFWLNLGAYFS